MKDKRRGEREREREGVETRRIKPQGQRNMNDAKVITQEERAESGSVARRTDCPRSGG